MDDFTYFAWLDLSHSQDCVGATSVLDWHLLWYL